MTFQLCSTDLKIWTRHWLISHLCYILVGVGPMTVAMLMMNTVDSAKRSLHMQKVSPTLRMGVSLAPLLPYLRRLIH